MLGRLLVTASFAALLSAAPAVAEEAQDPGMTGQDGQSGQVIKKKKKIQPEGQTTGEATGSQQPEPNQATSEEGQGANKKLKKKSQEATGEQPAGEDGQTTKKKKKVQQNTQTEETTGQQAIDKKKKAQQKTQQDQSSDQMTTGATGKVETELTPEKRTVIRERIVTKNVRRIERDKIDFDISVGIVIPTTTTIVLEPLPPDIIEVVPAYRGYLFFVLADGTIVIVDPSSHEIVFVLSA